MKRQRLVIPALMVATTAAAGTAVWLAPAASPQRVAGALLLALVLPGAALARLLFWEDSDRRVGRLLLVPALSLAAVILDSLVLYVVGIHLDAHAWTISIAGVTVAAAVGGAFRAVPLPRPGHHRPAGLGLLSLAAVALAILLAGAALVTIKGVRAQARADHFTQLWLLPTGGDRSTATVGLVNHEGSQKSYQLDVYVDRHLQSVATVRLNSGRSWTRSLSFAPHAQQIRATLALSDSPGVVYREVHVTLAPTSSLSSNLP